MTALIFLRVSVLLCIDISVACDMIFKGYFVVEKNKETEFCTKEHISETANISKDVQDALSLPMIVV